MTTPSAPSIQQQQPPLHQERLPKEFESDVIRSYRPPGASNIPHKPVEWVRNPADGSVLLDHHQRPISVDRLLATKPLRSELSSRPGPGNKKLTYLSGEGVTRTLNQVFGFDGWNLEIKDTTLVSKTKDDKQRWNVAYIATVRLTHRPSGAYKEDVGAGDALDRSVGTAVAHALKASITDAMKRAAKHFGDKLGNSLYQGSFSINKAPVTLHHALDQYDFERAQASCRVASEKQHATGASTATITTTNTLNATTTSSNTGIVKQEPMSTVIQQSSGAVITCKTTAVSTSASVSTATPSANNINNMVAANTHKMPLQNTTATVNNTYRHSLPTASSSTKAIMPPPAIVTTTVVPQQPPLQTPKTATGTPAVTPAPPLTSHQRLALGLFGQEERPGTSAGLKRPLEAVMNLPAEKRVAQAMQRNPYI
jgi:DNA recombination protein Rad52